MENRNRKVVHALMEIAHEYNKQMPEGWTLTTWKDGAFPSRFPDYKVVDPQGRNRGEFWSGAAAVFYAQSEVAAAARREEDTMEASVVSCILRAA